MLWVIVFVKFLDYVVGAGFLYQVISTKRDQRKFSPPATLVEIAGQAWHYKVMGEGDITVIIDSGAGGTHLDWQLVQPEIAKFTKVFSYDRAGYGWSAPSGEPRTAKQVVNDLRNLLKAANLNPPYILVGMSLSGFYSRLFAHQYPDEVVGMVLVDVAHEKMYEKLPVMWIKLSKLLDWFSIHIFPLLARVGLFRILATVDRLPFMAGLIHKMPPSVQPYARSLFSSVQHWKTFGQESSALYDSMMQVENIQVAMPFPKIPLVVLSSSRADFSNSLEMLEKLQALHAELAHEYGGKHQIVPDSGHVIQLDAPEVVVDAIQEVSKQVDDRLHRI